MKRRTRKRSRKVASHPKPHDDGPKSHNDAPETPSDAEKPVGPSVAPAGSDRRTHPRYEFIAAVELVATETGTRIETRIRDLSQQGCYVDTNDALPLGTITDVRI